MRALFFSSVAHELRTPLNSIIPMSKSLKKYITNPQGLRVLNVVTSAAIHLSFVIEDALDMSRLENNKFEINLDTFSLVIVLDEVVDTMRF
jgi:signal transduction histidine kinase